MKMKPSDTGVSPEPEPTKRSKPKKPSSTTISLGIPSCGKFGRSGSVTKSVQKNWKKMEEETDRSNGHKEDVGSNMEEKNKENDTNINNNKDSPMIHPSTSTSSSSSSLEPQQCRVLIEGDGNVVIQEGSRKKICTLCGADYPQEGKEELTQPSSRWRKCLLKLLSDNLKIDYYKSLESTNFLEETVQLMQFCECCIGYGHKLLAIEFQKQQLVVEFKYVIMGSNDGVRCTDDPSNLILRFKEAVARSPLESEEGEHSNQMESQNGEGEKGAQNDGNGTSGTEDVSVSVINAEVLGSSSLLKINTLEEDPSSLPSSILRNDVFLSDSAEAEVLPFGNLGSDTNSPEKLRVTLLQKEQRKIGLDNPPNLHRSSADENTEEDEEDSDIDSNPESPTAPPFSPLSDDNYDGLFIVKSVRRKSSEGSKRKRKSSENLKKAKAEKSAPEAEMDLFVEKKRNNVSDIRKSENKVTVEKRRGRGRPKKATCKEEPKRKSVEMKEDEKCSSNSKTVVTRELSEEELPVGISSNITNAGKSKMMVLANRVNAVSDKGFKHSDPEANGEEQNLDQTSISVTGNINNSSTHSEDREEVIVIDVENSINSESAFADEVTEESLVEEEENNSTTESDSSTSVSNFGCNDTLLAVADEGGHRVLKSAIHGSLQHHSNNVVSGVVQLDSVLSTNNAQFTVQKKCITSLKEDSVQPDDDTISEGTTVTDTSATEENANSGVWIQECGFLEDKQYQSNLVNPNEVIITLNKNEIHQDIPCSMIELSPSTHEPLPETPDPRSVLGKEQEEMLFSVMPVSPVHMDVNEVEIQNTNPTDNISKLDIVKTEYNESQNHVNSVLEGHNDNLKSHSEDPLLNNGTLLDQLPENIPGFLQNLETDTVDLESGVLQAEDDSNETESKESVEEARIVPLTIGDKDNATMSIPQPLSEPQVGKERRGRKRGQKPPHTDEGSEKEGPCLRKSARIGRRQSKPNSKLNDFIVAKKNKKDKESSLQATSVLQPMQVELKVMVEEPEEIPPPTGSDITPPILDPMRSPDPDESIDQNRKPPNLCRFDDT